MMLFSWKLWIWNWELLLEKAENSRQQQQKSADSVSKSSHFKSAFCSEKTDGVSRVSVNKVHWEMVFESQRIFRSASGERRRKVRASRAQLGSFFRPPFIGSVNADAVAAALYNGDCNGDFGDSTAFASTNKKESHFKSLEAPPLGSWRTWPDSANHYALICMLQRCRPLISSSKNSRTAR